MPVCLNCAVHFDAVRPHARACSPKCRMALSRASKRVTLPSRAVTFPKPPIASNFISPSRNVPASPVTHSSSNAVTLPSRFAVRGSQSSTHRSLVPMTCGALATFDSRLDGTLARIEIAKRHGSSVNALAIPQPFIPYLDMLYQADPDALETGARLAQQASAAAEERRREADAAGCQAGGSRGPQGALAGRTGAGRASQASLWASKLHSILRASCFTCCGLCNEHRISAAKETYATRASESDRKRTVTPYTFCFNVIIDWLLRDIRVGGAANTEGVALILECGHENNPEAEQCFYDVRALHKLESVWSPSARRWIEAFWSF
jgi:hypothetical protein